MLDTPWYLTVVYNSLFLSFFTLITKHVQSSSGFRNIEPPLTAYEHLLNCTLVESRTPFLIDIFSFWIKFFFLPFFFRKMSVANNVRRRISKIPLYQRILPCTDVETYQLNDEAFYIIILCFSFFQLTAKQLGTPY